MTISNADDVERLVRSEIERYEYRPPPPGSTGGVLWSEEKERAYLLKLQVALVKPYQQRFVVRETYEQGLSASPPIEEYWIVAKADLYVEFFDPSRNEFGLAGVCANGDLPVTVDVRGDLVGVFCAM